MEKVSAGAGRGDPRIGTPNSTRGQPHARRACRDEEKVTLLPRPVEARPQIGAKRGAMHAKAAIADRTVAFITSANLTGSAMDHNLETGILIRGGPLPGKLQTHFAHLEANGNLVAGT